MALTRKFLSALGIEADKVDEIITAHTEVTDALKAERDSFKADAEKLPTVQSELDNLKAEIDKGEKDPYKVKYEALKEEFEEYKADIDTKATKAKKDSAYRQLLKDCGIADKRIDAIMKITDVDSIELDDEGKAKEADKLTESIKTEWADFIPTEGKQGAKVATPPANNGGKSTMTKAEIRAISDPVARQKAMLENPSLFGLPEITE